MTKITRNGLPTRNSIDGLDHFCSDDFGDAEFQKLYAKYGQIENTDENRALLRKDVAELLLRLKYDGRLFQKDGVPLL